MVVSAINGVSGSSMGSVRPQVEASTGGKLYKQFADVWQSLEAKHNAKVSEAPKQFTQILELQREINQLSLRVQIASKVGEAAQGSVRSLERLAGS